MRFQSLVNDRLKTPAVTGCRDTGYKEFRRRGARSKSREESLMTIAVSMTVNGKSVSGDVEPRTLLVQFLREHLRMTGTHVGCDTSQCGACVVHKDGQSVKSCTILAAQCDGAAVATIEGLADGDTLHPMQEAFRENHGLQCGFCTPGMVPWLPQCIQSSKVDSMCAETSSLVRKHPSFGILIGFS